MRSVGRNAVFLGRAPVAAIAALLLAIAARAAAADLETDARLDMVRTIEVIARQSSGGATPTTLDGRARRDASRTAPCLRARRPAQSGLCQSAAANRLRSDHLATIHCRLDDRSAAARATRSHPRNWNRLRLSGRRVGRTGASSLYHRDCIWLGRAGGNPAVRPWLRRCPCPSRRRLLRMAGGSAIRRHRRHRSGAANSTASARTDEAGRAHGHSGWRHLPGATAYADREACRRVNPHRGIAAGRLRTARNQTIAMSLLLAVSLFSAAAVAYEILLTRLFNITLWH